MKLHQICHDLIDAECRYECVNDDGAESATVKEV